jgi:uncharacterized protein YfiM (DUF2279 family)
MKKIILLAYLQLFYFCSFGQDTITNKVYISKPLNYGISGSILLGQSFISSQQFFTKYPSSKFHFKGDLNVWKGMDKCFHMYASYQINSFFYELNKLSGMNNKKASNLAFIESSILGISKELYDGLIDIAGWSWYDVSMNVSGNLFFTFQQRIWNEQRIKLKYSYANSELQHYNPGVLGSSYKNYWLRDYNGQTYWMSSSLGKWNLTSNKWLKPISLTFGYGAQNMLNENNNLLISSDNLTRYRQYYLGLDIDWSEIETNKKYLKVLFYVLDHFRLPLPTLEFSQGKIKPGLLVGN